MAPLPDPTTVRVAGAAGGAIRRGGLEAWSTGDGEPDPNPNPNPGGDHPVWGALSALPAPPDFSAHADLVTLDIDLTKRTVDTNGARNIGVSGLTIFDYGDAGGRAVTTWGRRGGRPVVIRCRGRLTVNSTSDYLHLWGFSGVHVIGFEAIAGDRFDDTSAPGSMSAVLNMQNLGYFDPAHTSNLDHSNHEMRPVYIEGAHIDLKYKSASADLVRVTGATASLNIVNSRLVGCGTNNGVSNAAGAHPDVFHFQVGDHIRNLNGTKAINIHNCVTSSTYQLGIMRGEESKCHFHWRRHTHYAFDPVTGTNAQRGWWMAYDQAHLGTMESALFEDVYLSHQRFGGTAPRGSIVRYWVYPLSVWSNMNARPTIGQPLPGLDNPRLKGAPIYLQGDPPIDHAPAASTGQKYVSPWS